MEQTLSAPPKLSWLKRIVRYALHLIFLYAVVEFSIIALPHLIYDAIHWSDHWSGLLPFQAEAFLFSHLLIFSVAPALVAGLLINAKLRHQAAKYIWIVPVVVLAYEFVFNGPGMYPTMLGDSDFRRAFHFFFGGGLPTDVTNWHADWYRVWWQLLFTVPAYAGIAYSIGAFFGMSAKTRGLQRFMEKF